MVRKFSSDQSGFTLLEVMIAMVMLGMGLLSLAAAQMSSINIGHKSKVRSQAMYLAQEQLNTILSRPDADPFFAIGQTIDETDLIIDASNEDYTDYDRSTVILPGAPQPGLTTVTVTVQYKPRVGQGIVEDFVSIQGVK